MLLVGVWDSAWAGNAQHCQSPGPNGEAKASRAAGGGYERIWREWKKQSDGTIIGTGKDFQALALVLLRRN